MSKLSVETAALNTLKVLQEEHQKQLRLRIDFTSCKI